ncbi:Ig domain-containing protein [Tahibacter amnicola]|uniref:Ig domain-containing protein n=1 Tax=Tahibacter amnicola TaxID=2976241 RepID=A0ABY6BKI9_9GAMM|nr:Ig domain-containing protein [Tahibacter amnicola]UXI70284.1 Ig domain-containing protein [Tahibacter amnicola]
MRTAARRLVQSLAMFAALAGIASGASEQVYTGTFEPCDGYWKGGSCWWFGENDQSCDTVCADHGGDQLGSRLLTGSAGDSVICGELLTALNVINPLPVTEQVSLGGISGLGCGSDYTNNATSYRFTSTTTSSASSASNGSLYFRRLCACGSQPAPTSLSYASAPLQLPRGVAMTPASPTLVGYAKSYGVAPALPAGLQLNTTTGVISGTPTALQNPGQSHLVVAQNSGGGKSVSINVQVYPQAPTNFSYPGTPYIFNKDVAITPISPSVFGQVTSYTSDTMPTGLSVHPTTGVISGTPTVQQAAQAYSITAHNVDGTATTSVNITVQAPISCGSGGQAVGGTCWYFGQNDESCTTVCTTHGGYNAATLSFAGSGGSNANCGQVLTALGAFNPTPVTATASLNGISGMGCGSDYTNEATSYRFTSATTAGANSGSDPGLYFRRACSCNN